jgi:hypothetical protein
MTSRTLTVSGAVAALGWAATAGAADIQPAAYAVDTVRAIKEP